MNLVTQRDIVQSIKKKYKKISFLNLIGKTKKRANVEGGCET